MCSNKNAINLLEQNQDKINWMMLSYNKNAMHILEKNKHKIDLNVLCHNPSIFTYDYQKMKNNCNIFKEELIAYVFHPSRLFKNVTDDTDMDELFEHLE